MSKETKPQVPVAATGTAVVNWEDEIKKMAVATAEAEKPSSNWVSFKNGILVIAGNQQKNNKAEVVVLHSIFENQLYEGRYDPNKPQPPICYAFADTDDDLKPHKDAAKPQADSCDVCPHNAWGSDPEGGKGKACKNVRRLAMMSSNDLATVESVKKAEVALAKLPVTSVKNWSTYANQVANALKRPPLAVISEMSVDPDAKTQFQVNFRLVDQVEKPEIIQALLAKRGTIHELVYSPYEKPIEGAPAAAAGNKKY